MPHAFGTRARTRDLFSKPFRKHGPTPLSRLLTVYKIGDYVDVIADGAVTKGLPFKFYHGKTGRVYNVTKRALGVEVNKRVGNRIQVKRIQVRIEHVRKSSSREAFKERVKANDVKKAEANKAGKRISTKRINAQPRTEHKVVTKEAADFETFNPLRFKEVY